MQYARYILVDQQGNQPCMEGFAIVEEDDDRDLLLTTHVNGRSEQAFAESIADWLNIEVSEVKKMIKGNKLVIADDNVWTIKKETITEVDIDDALIAALTAYANS